MVRIRMSRIGRPHRPFYRISAVDQRTKRDGKVIEPLGWYDPMALDKTKQLELKADRIKHWLSMGAQPTDTVKDILVKHSLYDAAKRQEELDERKNAMIAAKAKADAAAAAAEAAKAAGGEKKPA